MMNFFYYNSSAENEMFIAFYRKLSPCFRLQLKSPRQEKRKNKYGNPFTPLETLFNKNFLRDAFRFFTQP